MKFRFTFWVILLVVFGSVQQLWASYNIKGKVNLKGEWQHQIFLSTIDKLDDYYNSNAELIVNVAPINNDGSFEITGDNLPEESQFYRLYLIKEEHSEFNACLFVGGEEHNFIHIILSNNTELEITADMKQFAPFGDYQIKGDTENQMMKNLARLVYPSYLFYEIKFPSELQFSQNKLNRDLFRFADTCKSTLVSLAAINNTDYDDYFETNNANYTQLGKELKTNLANHPYTQNYKRKLRYYSEDESNNSSLWFWQILSFGLLLLSAFLFFQNRKLQQATTKNEKPKTELPNLTPQEDKIFELIVSGKSNQEIANELFIELSTVKSHINKLYAKLQVKNRQEAKKLSKAL